MTAPNGHAEAVLRATGGPALPDAVTMRGVEATALMRVLAVARATVAAAQPGELPALTAVLADLPPALCPPVSPSLPDVIDLDGGGYSVRSLSEPGRVHTVTVPETMGDWTCTCARWTRARSWCRHMQQVSDFNRDRASAAQNNGGNR